MQPVNSKRVSWFIIALIIIVLILIGVALLGQSRRNTGTSGTAQKTDICKQDPTMTEGGRLVYPIATQWQHLLFLGQIFTAEDCGAERVASLSNVSNNMFESGLNLWLKKAPDAKFMATLEEVGFACADAVSKTECRKWAIADAVSISELLKLRSYAKDIERDDCLRCS